MRAHYFGGIDLVRFFAAALVLVFHLTYWQWTAPLTATSRQASLGLAQFPELGRFTSTGWIGVEIFFVVSGIVISQTALNRTAFDFFKSRFVRLMPAIWICATITAAVLFLVIGIPSKTTAVLLLKTYSLYPEGPWVDGVYWTLPVEIVFYGLVWLLVLCRQIHRLELFAAVIGLTSSVFLVAVRPGWNVWLHLSLLQHGCLFGLGIMIFIVSRDGLGPFRALLIGLLMIGCLVEISLRATEIPDQSMLMPHAVWLASVLFMIWSCLGGFAGKAVTRTLGLMTYPLYLIHNVLGCAILRLAPTLGNYFALLLAAATCLVIALVIVRIEKLIRPKLMVILETLRALPGFWGRKSTQSG